MASTKIPTTRKVSSTRKSSTSTRSSSTTKRKATSKTTEPVVVAETPMPVISGPELKKVELVNAVVERSGIKKRYAKPAIEAALAVLGEALAEGRPLNLKPLGKAKVQKKKDVSGGHVLTMRMRQPNADLVSENSESDDTPLAEVAE